MRHDTRNEDIYNLVYLQNCILKDYNNLLDCRFSLAVKNNPHNHVSINRTDRIIVTLE